MYYWDNKVVLDDDLYAQRVRWGPLVTPGVSLVGVAQSEVGINSNSNSNGKGPDVHIKWRLTVPAAILDQEWRL